MSRLIREFDWTATPLGPLEMWPQSLRSAVSLMLNSSFPMFIWWGEDMTYIYNEANADILGDKHPGALGSPARSVLSEMWDDVSPIARHVLEKSQPVFRKDQRLTMNRRGYDEEVYFTFSGSPILGHSGLTEGLFCVITETTEDVHDRHKLKEYQSQLEAVFQSALDGIAVFDMDGNMVLQNKALSEINGLPDTRTLRHGLDVFAKRFKLMNADRSELPLSEWPVSRILRGETISDWELRGLRTDTGQEWYFMCSGAPVYDSQGNQTLAVSIVRNITKRKLAEERLQQSEVRFRNLADNMAPMAWMSDSDGNRTWYNQRWYDYTGLSYDEAKGWGWKLIHHPDYLDKAVINLRRCLNQGKPWEETLPLRGRDGKYRWFLTKAVPIKDEQNHVTRWFGTNTDITDLRNANMRRDELEEIAGALKEQQAQLLALNQAKDEFISLASHQLRTPATGVKQYLGMLLGDFVGELTPAQREFAQHAYDSNERQLAVVSDLLSVAQADAGKIDLHKREVDLVGLINGILDEQAAKFAERRQTISFNRSKDSCMANVDTSRIRMVIENLVDNASKYTHEGKAIRVSLTHPRPDKVRIAIRDEGVGIRKKDIGHIFDKFMRADNPLSDVVGGSGLGLYLVRKIVELHGGTVKVDSEPGKGSTFTISLPVR